MNKENIMNLADAYAAEVANTPQMPTPLERKLAVVKIGAARAALEAALEQPEQQAEPDRRALQAEGKHPAPCARHCEAKAFEIEIRSLKSMLYTAPPLPVQEPAHGDIRALKHRIHELEGEVIGYKRMLEEAETAPAAQRKPLTLNAMTAIEEKVYMKTTHKGKPSFEYAQSLIRATEAAHGIKEKT
jgi:hypothetical protein